MNNLWDEINSEYLGIIWISDQNLSAKTPHFEEVNYLFNNLLKEQILAGQIGQDVTSDSNFFVSNAFNAPFFLSHIKYDEEKKLTPLETPLNLMNHDAKEGKKKLALILSGDLKAKKIPEKLSKVVKKDYPEVELTLLDRI